MQPWFERKLARSYVQKKAYRASNVPTKVFKALSTRPSGVVDYLCLRHENDGPIFGPNASTYVGVFEIHEVASIKSANLREG